MTAMVMTTAASVASPIGLVNTLWYHLACNKYFLQIGHIGRPGLRGCESFDGYEYIMDEGGGEEESEVEWRVVSRWNNNSEKNKNRYGQPESEQYQMYIEMDTYQKYKFSNFDVSVQQKLWNSNW